MEIKMDLLERWELSKSHIKQMLLSEQALGLSLEEVILVTEAALSDLKSTYMGLIAQDKLKPGPDQTPPVPQQ